MQVEYCVGWQVHEAFTSLVSRAATCEYANKKDCSGVIGFLMEALDATIDDDWLSIARLAKEFVFGEHQSRVAQVVIDTTQAVFASEDEIDRFLTLRPLFARFD